MFCRAWSVQLLQPVWKGAVPLDVQRLVLSGFVRGVSAGIPSTSLALAAGSRALVTQASPLPQLVGSKQFRSAAQLWLQTHAKDQPLDQAVSKQLFVGLRDSRHLLEAHSISFALLDPRYFGHVQLTVKDYTQFLQLLVRRGCAPLALSLFAAMRKPNSSVQPNAFTLACLMQGLCRTKRLDDSSKVFKLCVSAGAPSPNVVCWNTMIHCLADNGRIDDALELFAQMRSPSRPPGIDADAVTLTTILRALFRKHAVTEAERLFDEMRQSSLQDFRITIAVYNCMIHGYAAEGQISKAVALYQSLSLPDAPVTPDAETRANLISGCLKSKVPLTTLEGFTDLALSLGASDAPLDTGLGIAVYDAFIRSSVAAGKVDHAEALFDKLRAPSSHAKPDIGLFNFMLDTYIKHRRLPSAQLLFDQMTSPLFEPSPSPETWELMIRLYLSEKRPDDAYRTLLRMRDAALTHDIDIPSIELWRTVIEALALQDNGWPRARGIFESMLADNPKRPVPETDVQTWNAMIRLAIAKREPQTALAFLRRMLLVRNAFPTPDGATWNEFLSAYRVPQRDAHKLGAIVASRPRAGLSLVAQLILHRLVTVGREDNFQIAKRVLQWIQRVGPRRVAPWSILLAGLLRHRRHAEAHDVFYKLKDSEWKGPRPTTRMWNLVIESLIVERRLDEAAQLVELMAVQRQPVVADIRTQDLRATLYAARGQLFKLEELYQTMMLPESLFKPTARFLATLEQARKEGRAWSPLKRKFRGVPKSISWDDVLKS